MQYHIELLDGFNNLINCSLNYNDQWLLDNHPHLYKEKNQIVLDGYDCIYTQMKDFDDVDEAFMRNYLHEENAIRIFSDNYECIIKNTELICHLSFLPFNEWYEIYTEHDWLIIVVSIAAGQGGSCAFFHLPTKKWVFDHDDTLAHPIYIPRYDLFLDFTSVSTYAWSYESINIIDYKNKIIDEVLLHAQDNLPALKDPSQVLHESFGDKFILMSKDHCGPGSTGWKELDIYGGDTFISFDEKNSIFCLKTQNKCLSYRLLTQSFDEKNEMIESSNHFESDTNPAFSDLILKTSNHKDCLNMHDVKCGSMNIICFLSTVAAEAGFVWYFDKWNIIESLITWYTSSQESSRGIDVFDGSPCKDKLKIIFNDLLMSNFDLNENNFNRVLDNLNFDKYSFSEYEIDALNSFASDLGFEIKIYGSLQTLRDVLSEDKDFAEWAGFFNDDNVLMSLDEIEIKLHECFWWT